MAKVFNITLPTDSASLKLHAKQKIDVTYTVSNLSGRNLRGRIVLKQDDPAVKNKWVTLPEESEKDFGGSSSFQFTVTVNVPANAAPGKYTFRLDAVNSDVPDEGDLGPTVGFEVTGVQKAPFPKWIIPVAAVVLLLAAGTVTWLLWPKPKPTPAPIATVDPTPAPVSASTPQSTPPPTPNPTPLPTPAMVSTTNDLLWFRHEGRNDGSYRWAADNGKKVGSGWDFKQVFSGGDGIIYAIMDNGDLLWNRHEGRNDGTFHWAADNGKKVGSGWNVKHVFSGGDGIIYAITDNGDLLWFRHDGQNDGTFRWAFGNGKKVGSGWNVKHVFSGGDGIIYAIMDNGDLIWNRHEGRNDGTFRWAAGNGKKVGDGWNAKHVFSGGAGIIYMIEAK